MSLKIVLQNHNRNYYPGDTVEGMVVCCFRDNKNIRGIRLKFRGREHVHWSEKRGKHTTLYKGDNKFVAKQVYLTGEGSIGPGRFEYPFKFSLPGNAPSSYKGKHGNIRYYLKGNVDIPWAPDYDDEIDFVVVSTIDFNEMPGLEMNPVRYEDEKDLIWCCCCASGLITLRMYLDKEAYVLGEMMRVKVEVMNMSSENILQMSAKLTKTVLEKVTKPRNKSREDEQLLANVIDNVGVRSHGERTYHFELLIPNTVALPKFTICTLFEQWCTITIEGETPTCYKNIKMSTRITVGHIPVRGQEIIQSAYIGETQQSLLPAGLPFSPQYRPPNSRSLAHSRTDQALPYPEDPMGLPLLPRRNSQTGNIPGVHVATSGIAVYPPEPAANAPPEESAPSAPTRSEVVEDPSTSNELPPPSYSDVIKGTTANPYLPLK